MVVMRLRTRAIVLVAATTLLVGTAAGSPGGDEAGVAARLAALSQAAMNNVRDMYARFLTKENKVAAREGAAEGMRYARDSAYSAKDQVTAGADMCRQTSGDDVVNKFRGQSDTMRERAAEYAKTLELSGGFQAFRKTVMMLAGIAEDGKDKVMTKIQDSVYVGGVKRTANEYAERAKNVANPASEKLRSTARDIAEVDGLRKTASKYADYGNDMTSAACEKVSTSFCDNVDVDGMKKTVGNYMDAADDVRTAVSDHVSRKASTATDALRDIMDKLSNQARRSAENAHDNMDVNGIKTTAGDKANVVREMGTSASESASKTTRDFADSARGLKDSAGEQIGNAACTAMDTSLDMPNDADTQEGQSHCGAAEVARHLQKMPADHVEVPSDEMENLRKFAEDYAGFVGDVAGTTNEKARKIAGEHVHVDSAKQVAREFADAARDRMAAAGEQERKTSGDVGNVVNNMEESASVYLKKDAGEADDQSFVDVDEL
jgi:hypothetical protein